jgi:hypothetical protein
MLLAGRGEANGNHSSGMFFVFDAASEEARRAQ